LFFDFEVSTPQQLFDVNWWVKLTSTRSILFIKIG